MNAIFVKSPPLQEFTEISALVKNWERDFCLALQQRHAIKFDYYPMSGIPPDLQGKLTDSGYTEFVLENDRWQHFFIPLNRCAKII